MDLLAERGRRVTVEELNTTRLLAHARKQAVQRKFDDVLIVDVDAHHYENEHYGEILPFMENEVLKQLALDRFSPRVILFEHRHLSPLDKAAAKAHLASRYRVLDHGADFVCLRRSNGGTE